MGCVNLHVRPVTTDGAVQGKVFVKAISHCNTNFAVSDCLDIRLKILYNLT